MLRIRLLRIGKINVPVFRLVVLPQRTSPKSGRFLEVLGHYDPSRHTRSLKKDRIEYWLSQGAKPSDTVQNMLISEGIVKGRKIPVHKKPVDKEELPKTELPQEVLVEKKS